MKLNDIEMIELNEAFSSQSLAVIRDLGSQSRNYQCQWRGYFAWVIHWDATGAKLSVQLFDRNENNEV